MKKERNIRSLLRLLKIRYIEFVEDCEKDPKALYSGLCYSAKLLWHSGVITYDEMKNLIEYIEKDIKYRIKQNIPVYIHDDTIINHGVIDEPEGYFMFPVKDTESRIAWLNENIKNPKK